ncbi:uroporphyrin-III C-methyltransferase [Thelephora terrestris]|uniref:Uroporphyrin-III C-methyltransferase n=1 Tax=Thelephora terrestris TaxID=56493 RepID=A0A9P6HEJ6_9AGAM|nr:uroporphyrin-III C-methyltransferase [Thelephora terrestris]
MSTSKVTTEMMTPTTTTTTTAEPFPQPVGGASMLLSFRLEKKKTVIVGSSALAAKRAFAALEADSSVVVFSKGDDTLCDELRWRADHGQLTLIPMGPTEGEDEELLESYLESSTGDVSFVCVTDTLSTMSNGKRSLESAKRLHGSCRRQRVPVNFSDLPQLCDFSFTSSHRFIDTATNAPSSLQIGVTANGQGCRISGRIRRDIVAALPKEVGVAVSVIGRLRRRAKEEGLGCGEGNEGGGREEAVEEATPNLPVAQRTVADSDVEASKRRMRWVSQISEYWSLSRLAEMKGEDIDKMLSGDLGLVPSSTTDLSQASHHPLNLETPPRVGRILLVGSGPGHPSLLTVATRDALTKHADLVLSDKLVPAAVLAIIPSHVQVQIARKFPGNADSAQSELQETAVEAARRGLTVVRLKQGDPTVYGRAGEEIIYFRSQGFEPIVVPGVSSALAGPIFAGVPVTQRGVAESFIVCTGVGKGGKGVKLPGYERSRTLVILMGVARLGAVLDTLQNADLPPEKRDGEGYPGHVPIAIIERATMPDQRTVFSTLKDVSAAMESVGEQRPPGMIVVGWTVLCLWKRGDVSVLDDRGEDGDETRVRNWLEGKLWRVAEGLSDNWINLL